MERTTRRYGLGTRVFATDTWTVIRRSTQRRCLTATKDAAFALLEQAEDFYRAAQSGVKAAKPLVMYYCMMNLAKAFGLCCRQREEVDNAMHSLSEKLDPPPKNVELVNAWLNAQRTVAPGPVPVPLDFSIRDDRKMVESAVTAIRDAAELHSRAGNLIMDANQLNDLATVLVPALIGNWVTQYATGITSSLAPQVLLGVLQTVDDFADCFKYDCTCSGTPQRRFYKSLSQKHCGC